MSSKPDQNTIEDYIRRELAAAPNLSDEAAQRIATLLMTGGAA
jgi:hypothetical protein